MSEDVTAQQFARSFITFLDWAQTERQGSEPANEVVVLIREHLGGHGLDLSVVSSSVPPFEHVNLQVAVDAWSRFPGRSVNLRGLALPPHFMGLTLQQLLTGESLPPVRLSAPELVDLPSGPNRTLACVTNAVLLVDDADGPYVVLLRGPDGQGDQNLRVEVAGLPTAKAQAVLADLARLRLELNVYRGQVIELVGGGQVRFADLPPTQRDDVVLSEEVFNRIERHTVDIARHREALLAAGQHLKRGLLLYGPPGTGKTHTTRYIIGQLAGATVIMLSGRSLHLIGTVTNLARDLQPAVVVLEDVDLVAGDRSFGPGPNPVLFELLDAMDGAAADADLLFLLTTNRADLLESALAARPGRVDVAVEIPLPDSPARRRLLELYGRGVPLELSDDDVAAAVERMDGVTASFVKELLRRSVLEALRANDFQNDDGSRTVTGQHLSLALDDLLDSSQGVTRALLGVPADQSGPPAGPPIDSGGGFVTGPGGRRTFRSQIAYRMGQ